MTTLYSNSQPPPNSDSVSAISDGGGDTDPVVDTNALAVDTNILVEDINTLVEDSHTSTLVEDTNILVEDSYQYFSGRHQCCSSNNCR